MQPSARYGYTGLFNEPGGCTPLPSQSRRVSYVICTMYNDKGATRLSYSGRVQESFKGGGAGFLKRQFVGFSN